MQALPIPALACTLDLIGGRKRSRRLLCHLLPVSARVRRHRGRLRQWATQLRNPGFLINLAWVVTPLRVQGTDRRGCPDKNATTRGLKIRETRDFPRNESRKLLLWAPEPWLTFSLTVGLGCPTASRRPLAYRWQPAQFLGQIHPCRSQPWFAGYSIFQKQDLQLIPTLGFVRIHLQHLHPAAYCAVPIIKERSLVVRKVRLI
jgi:hypothetical protein